MMSRSKIIREKANGELRLEVESTTRDGQKHKDFCTMTCGERDMKDDPPSEKRKCGTQRDMVFMAKVPEVNKESCKGISSHLMSRFNRDFKDFQGKYTKTVKMGCQDWFPEQ